MPLLDDVFETNSGRSNEEANDEYEEPEVENIKTIEQVLWIWIEKHTKMCKYSLDIRKCEVSECCSPKRASE
ncbi:3865_t:CDS:1, partial [Racocetra persica]